MFFNRPAGFPDHSQAPGAENEKSCELTQEFAA
jgi:hypothetical protein